MKAAIRQRALELGFDACRFTTAAPPAGAARYQAWLAAGHHGEMQWLDRNQEKRGDPQKILPGARSLIALAVSYHHPAPAPCSPAQVARYAQYEDYHERLAGPLAALTQYVDSLKTDGQRSLWYVDTGPILERELAQRAGLGFAGKHTNLISRQLGNWFFLAEILTTLELEPDAAESNHCGHCTRCLTACPTQAITAPFVLDARRCISYLTIELKGAIPEPLRPLIGGRIYGCDECLAVCPWNKFAQAARLLAPYRRADLAVPQLLDFLEMDAATFKKTFANSPILRTKRRGFLRNVCVALGNIGDHHALPALNRRLSDPEPLIAEHAHWAIQQIENRLASSATDPI